MNIHHALNAFFVSILIGLALAAPAQARQDGAPNPQDAMIPLSDEPYDAPALGLSLYLPEDSVITSQAITVGTGRLQVQPRGKEWLLQVYNQRSTNKQLTLTEVVDSIIKQRQESEMKAPLEHSIVDPRTRKAIASQPFERTDNLSIAGVPAARVYMGFRQLAGRSLTTTGYTVFNTAPGEFLIAQFDTPDKEFERTRRLYETILATVVFRDMSGLQAERAAGLLTGMQLLSSITQEDLESLLDSSDATFLRLYEPSPTRAQEDDTEVAWQRVEIRKGQLGELNHRKQPVDWSPSEREYGFLALVTAAYVSPDGSSVQMEARYFLSMDRQRETWFVQNVVRHKSEKDGKPVQADSKFEQTVVRQGNRLTSSVVHPAGAPTITEFDLPEEGYISKVELMLLPRIVAMRGTAAVFGFYTYDSRLDQVVLRRDIFDRNELGNWSSRSRDAESAREVVSTYDKTGRLLSQALPEGRVIEPIEPQRLLKIWRDKGLTE